MATSILYILIVIVNRKYNKQEKIQKEWSVKYIDILKKKNLHFVKYDTSDKDDLIK